MKRIEGGYILLARRILDSPIWRDNPHVLKLFIYLCEKARHDQKPRKYPHVTIKRGELVTALMDISEDNEYMENGVVKCWSRAKVSRMLNILAEKNSDTDKDGYIELKSDTYGTHIRICNYETYQNADLYKSDSGETPPNTSATLPDTGEHQVSINNKENNDKKEKNDKKEEGGCFDKLPEMIKQSDVLKKFELIPPGTSLDKKIKKWNEKYPNIDATDEFDKAEEYIRTAKRKYKSFLMFFDNWLSRAKPRQAVYSVEEVEAGREEKWRKDVKETEENRVACPPAIRKQMQKNKIGKLYLGGKK